MAKANATATCPHCNETQEVEVDYPANIGVKPAAGQRQETQVDLTCEKCGKKFPFTVQVST